MGIDDRGTISHKGRRMRDDNAALLPGGVVKLGAEYAGGAKFMGVDVDQLTRDELISVIGLLGKELDISKRNALSTYDVISFERLNGGQAIFRYHDRSPS